MASKYNACFGDGEYMASLSDPTRRGLIGAVGWFSDIYIGEGATADIDGVVVDAAAVLDAVPIPVSDEWEPEVYTAALKRAGWEPLMSLPDRPVQQFTVRWAEEVFDDGDVAMTAGPVPNLSYAEADHKHAWSGTTGHTTAPHRS